jgi:hypothetical protein
MECLPSHDLSLWFLIIWGIRALSRQHLQSDFKEPNSPKIAQSADISQNTRSHSHLVLTARIPRMLRRRPPHPRSPRNSPTRRPNQDDHENAAGIALPRTSHCRLVVLQDLDQRIASSSRRVTELCRTATTRSRRSQGLAAPLPRKQRSLLGKRRHWRRAGCLSPRIEVVVKQTLADEHKVRKAKVHCEGSDCWDKTGPYCTYTCVLIWTHHITTSSATYLLDS